MHARSAGPRGAARTPPPRHHAACGRLSMAWLMVIVAGGLEMVWSYSAKRADGFTHWGWVAVTMVASLASFLLLTFSLRTLQLGTAYAVWTGIGATGSFIVGVVLLGESFGIWRVLSALLIVAGLIGLRMTQSR